MTQATRRRFARSQWVPLPPLAVAVLAVFCLVCARPFVCAATPSLVSRMAHALSENATTLYLNDNVMSLTADPSETADALETAALSGGLAARDGGLVVDGGGATVVLACPTMTTVKVSAGAVSLHNFTLKGTCASSSETPLFEVAEGASLALADIAIHGAGSPLFSIAGSVSLVDSRVLELTTDAASFIAVAGSGSLSLVHTDFASVSAAGPGALVSAGDDAQVSVRDSSFAGVSASTAVSAGVFDCSGSAHVAIDGSSFANVASGRNAGLLRATESCTADIASSRIVGAAAPRQGGVLLATDDAFVTLSDSLVDGASAGTGGGIASVWGAAVLYARNATVRGATAGSDGVGGGVVAIDSSTVYLEACYLDGSDASRGGFLYAVGSSTVTLEGGEYRAASANDGGFAAVAESASLGFVRVALSHAMAADGGGALLVMGSASVTAASSSFAVLSSDTDGGFAWVEGTASLALDGCTVVDASAGGNGGVAAVLGAANLTAIGSRFAGGAAGGSGGAFYARSHGTFTLSGCTLIDMQAYAGGALTLLDHGEASVRDSVAVNVRADSFGGFFGGADRTRASFSGLSLSGARASGAAGFFLADSASMRLRDAHAEDLRCATDPGALAAVTDAGALDAEGVFLYNCSAGGAAGIFLSDSGSAQVIGFAVSHLRTNGLNSGAFAIARGSATLTVGNSTFTDMYAGRDGGFLVAFERAAVAVTSSRFERLACGGAGSVASAYDSASLVLSGSYIENVTAANHGGAFHLFASASARLSGNVALRPSALAGGYAAVFESALLHVDGDAVWSPRASDYGGFLHCETAGEASASIANVSVQGAYSARGGAVLHTAGCRVLLSRASVQNTCSVSGLPYDAATPSSLFGLGGALLARAGAILSVVDSSFGLSSSENGGGGFVAVLGSSSCALANVTAMGSARMGGVAFVSQGSRLDVARSHFAVGTAALNGGCVFVTRGSAIALVDSSFGECVAGTDPTAYGAGGLLFAEAGAVISDASFVGVRAARVAAAHGTAVFTSNPLPDTAKNSSRLSVSSAAVHAWLPAGWQAGGLVSSSVAALSLPTLCSGVPGAEVSPFVIEIRDAYGAAVSVPPGDSPSLRIAVDGPASSAIPLRGETERVFGSAASVTVSGLRVYAPPGTFRLRLVPANLRYSPALPPFENATTTLVLSGCPVGQYLALSADGLVACTQAPAAPSSSANVGLAVGLSLGIGVPALAILALVVVAWRRGIFRKVDGSGRDAFLSGYVAKNPSLAAMEVPRDAIQLRDELGRGEFGVVYRANVVVGGRPRQCAAKLIREGAGFQARVDFFREGEVMMGLPQHAHVVQCVGVSLAEEPMMLLIEYVAHGSAHDFVADIPRAQRNNPFVADMLGSFARGIAAGMGHLVAHSIVHRDLAARNVLIGTDAFGEYIAKVADFGLSRDTAGMDYYRKEGGVKLPIRWTSPEALDTRVFTTKSDVWSFGVTAWELYSFGAIPYGLVENAEVPLLLAKGHRLERPPCCPMDVFEVLMACWSMDPAERPTFDEIFASLEEAAGIARSLPGDDVLQQLIATKHRDSPFGGSTGSIYDNVPESDPNFYSESMLGRSLRRMAEAQRASSQSASVIVGEGSRPSSPGPSATYDNVWDGSTSPISRSRSPSSKKPHKIYENVLERSLKSELRKMGGEKESPSTARALGFESSSLRDALAAAISRDHSLGARRTDEIALETIVESTV